MIAIKPQSFPPILRPSQYSAIRKHLGLTQGELANLMETSQQAVSLIERGVRLAPPRYASLLLAMMEAKDQKKK